MKICFMTKEEMSLSEAPPSRILNLREALIENHEVYIISRKAHININNNIEINVSSDSFIENQIFKVLSFFAALRLLFIEKIDFFVTRSYYDIVLLYPWTRLTGSKIIYDMHCFRNKELNVEGKHFKARIVKFFETIGHRLCDYISVISDGIMEDLGPKLQKKAFMLPNGVDIDKLREIKRDKKLERVHSIPPDKKIVGFIGNWMGWVDVKTLLDSSRTFKDNCILVVIGKCYGSDDLNKLRKKYPNVRFTGRLPHDEALSLLARMDVCILPYKNAEVLKHLSIRKTKEYLAAGKPIIMSDSPIAERSFLKEKENMLIYKAGDPKDLSKKICELLSKDDLLKNMGVNNRKISESLSWKNVIENSRLKEIIPTFKPGKIPKKAKVSIIIKTLNEQRHIEKCIRSALKAIDGLDGEVILVDSLSTDKTVKLAKRFPIQIFQIKDSKDQSCGVGPQTGFLKAKGDYIYILDGDMVIHDRFIKEGIRYLQDDRVAGVGGNIEEQSKANLAFQVRSRKKVVDRIMVVKQLGMGGLYRRSAIEKVGYFSHPQFYAYEEYDLGDELRSKGFTLLRIPQEMVLHYGDTTTSIMTVIRRIKSKYILGSGQYLKRSFLRGRFLQTAWILKIYILTLIWQGFALLSLILIFKTIIPLITYLGISSFFMVLLFIRKRHLNRVVFSILSWNTQAIGMLTGIFLPQDDPKEKITEISKIQ